jgi:tetratricopeptide (TPR) repeat protein
MKMANAKAAFEAGIQAEESGDFDKARRFYQRASLLDPTAPYSRLRLASLLLSEGKWKEAIRVARQLTKRWPNVHHVNHAYIVIARSYAELGRWRMAERFYRRSLAIKQRPEAWVLLSRVLSHLGRNDEVEECLRKALSVDRNYDEAHYNLGCIYSLKGNLTLAEKHLKRAIEIDPKYTLAFAKLGQLLSGQKDRTKEAAMLLRRAVKYNPNDRWSVAYLANALWALRKLKAADEHYRRLIQLWPDGSLPYWCYGGFLAYEGKDSSTAERYLRKAIEIEPRSELANYHLGKHLLYWDRKAEAKRFLRKAAQLGYSQAHELLQSF